MKGFVFDLDNTLFDRYGTLTEIANRRYEEVKDYINPGYDLPRALDHFIHTERLFVQKGFKSVYKRLLEESFFHPDRIPSYEAFYSFIMDSFHKIAVPFPYARPLLEKMRKMGYKTALVTNGRRSLQYDKMNLVDLADCFDVVVCSYPTEGDCDIMISKPKPEPFLLVAEKLGIRPAELYYVGDNPINDVKGSREAGYIPVWIRSFSPWLGPAEEMPEFCYDDVRGLEELL